MTAVSRRRRTGWCRERSGSRRRSRQSREHWIYNRCSSGYTALAVHHPPFDISLPQWVDRDFNSHIAFVLLNLWYVSTVPNFPMADLLDATIWHFVSSSLDSLLIDFYCTSVNNASRFKHTFIFQFRVTKLQQKRGIKKGENQALQFASIQVFFDIFTMEIFLCSIYI